MADGASNSSYRAAVEFLYELQWFGANFGLETTRRLAAFAGNPERNLRFIHVAGTNGKGSTCAILESIYRAAGLRVGLFTSPHLVSFRERIQINRRLISEPDVVRLVAELRPFLKEFPAGEHPTFFEAVTVMALKYFAQQNCDVVIWETGLGGRLDATNIVMPIASVITNVQYDHQKWLGETLAQIAAEKAGIIKPGAPIVSGVDVPEAKAVIESVAQERGCPLIRAPQLEDFPMSGSIERLPLFGHHQRQNAAIALATIGALQSVIPVDARSIETGLSTVEWPGRFQVLSRAPGQTLVLDGAHNLAGAEALVSALSGVANEPVTLILGILGDKDWRGMCQILSASAAKILLVPVQNERTALPAELASACQSFNPKVKVVCCANLDQALNESTNDRFVVIGGSLYLIGEAMELLNLHPDGSVGERRLNDWAPARQSQ